ncbi:hypothetical protein ACWCXX_36315 [Streptomyces sp. NPDC001732]
MAETWTAMSHGLLRQAGFALDTLDPLVHDLTAELSATRAATGHAVELADRLAKMLRQGDVGDRQRALSRLGLLRDLTEEDTAGLPAEVTEPLTGYQKAVQGLKESVSALEQRHAATLEASRHHVARLFRHEKGIGRVGLLIEGNPDAYDVLDGLPVTNREIRVTPGVPIGLLAASRNADRFRTDPFARSFAYFSGLHSRHKLPAEQFLGELTCYLTAGITCVLVEMYKGDVELALRAARLSGRPATAVLMSDYFSGSENTLVLNRPDAEAAHRAAEATRGGLCTMLITNEELR